MHATRVFFTICIALLITLCHGCGDFGSTEYYHVNLTDQTMMVTIVGVTPDASPGALVAGAGTEQLMEVTIDVGGAAVHVADMITITWTVRGDTEEKKADLKRDDLGYPRHGSRRPNHLHVYSGRRVGSYLLALTNTRK